MPKLERTEKVPDRLLTEEQAAWTKQFKEAKRVAQMSEMGMFGLRELLGKALEALMRLSEGKPEKAMIELGRQPEGSAEQPAENLPY